LGWRRSDKVGFPSLKAGALVVRQAAGRVAAAWRVHVGLRALREVVRAGGEEPSQHSQGLVGEG